VVAATTDLEIPSGGTFVITVPSDVTMYTTSLSCSAETQAGASIDTGSCSGSSSARTLTVEFDDAVSGN